MNVFLLTNFDGITSIKARHQILNQTKSFSAFDKEKKNANKGNVQLALDARGSKTSEVVNG